MNMHTKFKRVLSGVLSLAMAASILPSFPVIAEETTELYPYTMFAASDAEGAITINSNNFCLNGNIAANGTIASSGNMNINGIKTENANEEMVYILEKLSTLYFSGDNVDIYCDDYNLEDLNIIINDPMDVYGSVELTGNISLSSGIKAFEDVQINGEVKNTREAVICSETGDIVITSTNVNFSGLIYAPYGDIIIDTDNLNLNNVIIIGQTITLDCPSINANYNSSMGEVVGTGSSTGDDNVDENVVLYAFGEYNANTNSIDIEWETNYANSSYEVWCSEDNINYTSVAVVFDEMTYRYPIVEDFDIKYFKISLTTNYGELVESIPFFVTKGEDGYTVEFLDSDGDGLPDIYEEALGTDANKADTDGDGLTDYQEVFVTGTDPTKYDSVTEGISDADADSDGDGLSNAQEIELGTDPQNTDTDEDGLSDYDELNVYGTDPLNPDTDGDGLKDGDEPHIGLDPTNPETFDKPDGEYYSNQEINFDSNIFSEVNKDDSPYKISLSMETNGYAESNLKIDTSRYSYAIENDAMIGGSLDIEISETCNPKNIVIRYLINDNYTDNTLNKYTDCDEFKGIKRLNIFKYFDDINMLLPIETKFDVDNNILYAEVDELGTYCIMDMEIWFNNLGLKPTTSIEKLSFLDPDISLGDIPPVVPEETYTLNDSTYAIFNLSGLTWDEASRCCNLLGGHLATITSLEEQQFIEKYVLINGTKNSYWLGASQTDLGWKWLTGEDFSNYTNWAKGQPDNCERQEDRLMIYKETNPVNKYGTYGYWNDLNNSGICKNETFFGAENIGFICEWDSFGTEETKFETLIATKWEKIVLKDKLNAANGVDTDSDSLTDWKEVNTQLLKWNDDGSFELPTFFDVYNMTDYISAIKAFDRLEGTIYELPILTEIYTLRILPIFSNPCNEDSDNDSIPDYLDLKPLCLNYTSEELNKTASKKIENNSSYIINAAKAYEVDPCIVAACIFTEQDLNYNWVDVVTDDFAGFYGVNTSVGLGQVRIKTAKFIEEQGYIEKAQKTDNGWYIPFIGFVHGTENMAREQRLENNEWNTMYVSAYLRYFIDTWENDFPEINIRTDILASLYNIGHESTSPHSDPEANEFGVHADKYYFMMYSLLYGY